MTIKEYRRLAERVTFWLEWYAAGGRAPSIMREHGPARMPYTRVRP